MAPQPNIIETISVDNGVSWVETRRVMAPQTRGMTPTAQAALWGLLLLFVPAVGLLLYLGLVIYTAWQQSLKAGGRGTGSGPLTGNYESVYLNIRDVQRVDTSVTAGSARVSGYADANGWVSGTQSIQTHTSTSIWWNFYTDHGIKVLPDYAYNAWLNAGRPQRIVFSSWRDAAPGMPVPGGRAAQPSVPVVHGKVHSAKAKGQRDGLPSADLGSAAGTQSSSTAGRTAAAHDPLLPSADLTNKVVCSYCGTVNELGVHRCTGCYKVLPTSPAYDLHRPVAGKSETGAS